LNVVIYKQRTVKISKLNADILPSQLQMSFD